MLFCVGTIILSGLMRKQWYLGARQYQFGVMSYSDDDVVNR